MRLTTLNKLFREENPTGTVVRNLERGRNWYTVWFRTGTRGYNHYAPNVYDLAERLELIPDIDIPAEAREIVTRLEAGEDEVVAPAGCGDTARRLNRNIAEGYVRDGFAESDEYDRPLSRYYLDDSGDEWSSTLP